ncbi:hypothetical protein DQ04_01071040 [Trypanosoma grayi]|uniref:hypothetical protein n=1 Tax=Trypanosoma grayi TaxID=71804 RepID=UPI0004F4900C|nr:hypothetical protein DQ04_01071040 [Trypanosoma grayi]KEG13323.1 hypothetical protein DQ04_01071040 [Trypanosoma grayi]
MASRHGGGNASGFAAAAKVLFDSAKKVGAVEPLDVTSKLYAQQLKRIQSQSRKKGGSLGSVSYKVAEFLATQRTPKANIIRNSTSIAKRVPLIDIPLQRPNKKDAAVVEKPHTQKVPTLDFVTKKVQQQQAQPDTSRTVPTPLVHSANESLMTDRPVPTLDFVVDQKKMGSPQHRTSSEIPIVEEVAEVEAATDTLQKRPLTAETVKATIAEDKPLFEAPGISDSKPSLSVDRVVTAQFEPAPQTPERPTRHSITVPISSGVISSSSQRPEPIQSETISVDVWELQREKEIEQLRKSQETAERERLAIQREEEHKKLGDEWVKSRTTVTQARHMDVGTSALAKMYFCSQWDACFESFKQIVATSTPSAVVSKQAVRIMERNLKNVPIEKRDAVKSALLKELKERRLHDEVTKFELRHENGEKFLQIYRSAPNSVRDALDYRTVLKTVATLVGSGSWEEAIQLVDQSQKRFHDKTGQLELNLLTKLRGLDEEAVKAIVEYVTKTLTASERFSTMHKLKIAMLEKGSRRRQMLAGLISTSDVNEVIYAELLRITSNENVNNVIEEVCKRGLNREDPAILTVLCWKSFDPENPQELFREIEKQEAKIGIRPEHLLAAVAMARAAKTEDALRSAVRVVKKAPIFKAKYTLRKLLPFLHEKKMNKEIVELADFYSTHVPIAEALPNAVAFVNSAMQAEGRAPLSDKSVSLLQIRPKSSPESTEPLIAKSTKAELSVSSEVMLQCAKERDWEKALALINSMSHHDTTKEDSETLTLLYNCGLSAAVEKPDVVKELYARMVENGVQKNATTNNAVLSSLMRSSRLEEAVEFYKQTDLSLRDANTYSVMLSLLGKNNMWQDAVKVFEEARGRPTKAPPVVYALGINAVHNHSWIETLNIFQALRKDHGANNVKDAVVDKVVRCLTQNKRTAELQKLEMELSKAKKKQQSKNLPK